MIHQLFDNIYWKSVIVIILALIATFANEVDALKDGVIVYIILGILLLLIYTKDDMGLVVLISVLFILAYNNVVHKSKPLVNSKSKIIS